MRAPSRAFPSFAVCITWLLPLLSLTTLVPCLPSAAAQDSSTAEMTSRETEPSFKLEVQRNLVLVRVVARDSKGHVVGNLRKEDFRLLDNGKPQTITAFTV